MCVKSKDPRSSSSSRSAKRMKGETGEGDGPPQQSEIDDFLQCIQQDLIEQQENSQNLHNREQVRDRPIERAPGKTSGSPEKEAKRKAEPVREERLEREESDGEAQASDPKSCIESDQFAALNESNKSDLVSIASLSESSDSEERTLKKTSTHLEQIQKDYASIPKSINTQRDQFRPFDCVRPAYLLKEALNSHSLNAITRLYLLNTKEKNICPYLLSKTGFLLFRKFIELRSEKKDELCSDLAEFVKHVRFLTGERADLQI